MEVLRCRICGGSLEVIEGTETCECSYCGTRQMIDAPKAPAFVRRVQADFNQEEVFSYIKDNFYKNGQKIKAAIYYREKSGLGLAEAKEAVEQMWEKMKV